MRVGFIGLGRMGQGMARNLQKSGAELLIFDRDPSAAQTLISGGATWADSVGELAKGADVVFMSLPGPVQIEEVVFGAGGILENTKPGQALFDLSTSSPTLARRIHQEMAERGASMFDSPISGGPAGAASGDLVLWVGGDRDKLEPYLDTLKTFGKPHYVGPIGAGAVTKLVHNLTGYMIMESLAETFSLAVKAGVDPLELSTALRLGMVGKSSPLDMLTNQFLPGTFETPAFLMKLAHKDVTLATNLGKELGVPMRLANLTLEEMTEALARGYGDWDSRSYLKLQLDRAGVEISVDPARIREAIANPPS